MSEGPSGDRVRERERVAILVNGERERDEIQGGKKNQKRRMKMSFENGFSVPALDFIHFFVLAGFER